MGGFFSLSKREILTQDLNSFVHLCTLPKMLYGVTLISRHTLSPHFTISELVMHLTINGASQLL